MSNYSKERLSSHHEHENYIHNGLYIISKVTSCAHIFLFQTDKTRKQRKFSIKHTFTLREKNHCSSIGRQRWIDFYFQCNFAIFYIIWRDDKKLIWNQWFCKTNTWDNERGWIFFSKVSLKLTTIDIKVNLICNLIFFIKIFHLSIYKIRKPHQNEINSRPCGQRSRKYIHLFELWRVRETFYWSHVHDNNSIKTHVRLYSKKKITSLVKTNIASIISLFLV